MSFCFVFSMAPNLLIKGSNIVCEGELQGGPFGGRLQCIFLAS